MGERKTVVLTGAASGVGAACAGLLAGAGVRVVGLDVKPGSEGLEAFLECDLGDPGSIDRVATRIGEPVDALLNVAGVPGPRPAERVVAVNFLGLRHLTEALLPRLRDGASIVNVASIAGRGWQRHLENVSGLVATPSFEAGLAWCTENPRALRDPYTFSKECVVLYTLLAAGRERARGIRCNAVSPGAIDTPILPAFDEQVGEAQAEWFRSQIGPPAPPVEIAKIVVLLAVGDCSWINGADVPVDNGLTAGIASGWIDVSKSPAVVARARRRTA